MVLKRKTGDTHDIWNKVTIVGDPETSRNGETGVIVKRSQIVDWTVQMDRDGKFIDFYEDYLELKKDENGRVQSHHPTPTSVNTPTGQTISDLKNLLQRRRELEKQQDDIYEKAQTVTKELYDLELDIANLHDKLLNENGEV